MYNEYTDTEKGTINYWMPPVEHQYNSDKILGLDLDWTLIKPKKGKVFPINSEDWEFLIDEEGFDCLNSYLRMGYKIVVFTNQALIAKGKSYDMEGFKQRWDMIYSALSEKGIKSVYMLFAIRDDFYRKPCSGMWDFMVDKLNGNIKIAKKQCLFIGDAAGREKDHSAADLQFASNIGINFNVPEVVFGGDKSKGIMINVIKKRMNDAYSSGKMFNPMLYLEGFSDVRDEKVRRNRETFDELKKQISLNKQTLILFVGSPSSAKTSFYTQQLLPYLEDQHQTDKWVYLSQDTFDGTPAKFTKEVQTQLHASKNIIIDNTNPTVANRKKYLGLDMSEDLVKIVIYFPIEKQVVMHLNSYRTKLINIGKLKNKERVPTVAINSYWKRFEKVDKGGEGIDVYLEWEFIPNKENFSQFI